MSDQIAITTGNHSNFPLRENLFWGGGGGDALFYYTFFVCVCGGGGGGGNSDLGGKRPCFLIMAVHPV